MLPQVWKLCEADLSSAETHHLGNMHRAKVFMSTCDEGLHTFAQQQFKTTLSAPVVHSLLQVTTDGNANIEEQHQLLTSYFTN